MRIPHTVSRNVFEAYRCSLRTLSLPYQQDRSLRAEDESWDDGIIPDLKFLAVRVLVQQWELNPILDTLPTPVDRDMVLEMLPTNLPFELTIRKIPDEIFWKRAAEDRWEYNYPYDHGNSWRRLYVERHLAEHLEQVEASYFEQQEESSSDLIELCKNYVYTLGLRSLIPTKPSFEWSGEEEADRCNVDEDVVHHVPFDNIFPRLPNLTELHLNFGMIYMNDGFDWRDFKFSIEDSKNLGQAIEQCEKLETFRLTRSNLDHRRAAGLLQGIASNGTLLELDLSHCKLGDLGAQAIGEFLTLTKSLKILHLANNYIGPSGIQGLVHGLLQPGSAALTDLNLRLNPLSDEGGTHICSLLLRYAGLERLNVSGCGLTAASGIGMAECIASGYLKCTSLVLDLSNNDFGPSEMTKLRVIVLAGEAYEVAVRACGNIVGLDARLCNFSKESEYSIGETVARNREFRENSRSREIRRETSRGRSLPSGSPSAAAFEIRGMQMSGIPEIPAFPSNDISAISADNSAAVSFTNGEKYRRESFVASSPVRVASASSDDHAKSKTNFEESSDISEEKQQNWQPTKISP